MWQVASPDKNIKISVTLGEQGELLLLAEKSGKAVAKCLLGISTSLCDFTAGLEYSLQKTRRISETYSLPIGKKAVYENKANEIALHYRKNGCVLVLRMRAYDNGVAFRYEIPVEGSSVYINSEITEFAFPDRYSKLWLQDWVASYEAPYSATEWGASHDGRRYGMPALIHSRQDSVWIMINEANVLNTNGAYCVSHLRGTDSNALRFAFAPEERGRALETPLPFHSPWRYLLIEDSLDGIVNATLNYNLNPPSVIEDASWIKPSRALWAWWASDMGAQLFTEALQYVDFAAAMGFEAVLLDAGWDYTWIREFCDYAHARGVSPWVWTAMQHIITPELAGKYLAMWKSFGVDGVKIDFFENDSSYTASRYDMMAGIMSEQKLMINFHGATKPMGEGRTWPHLMSCEGIMGMEYYKWSDMPDAAHNCTVPFIRNAAGPMDYTPTGFSNRNRNTTMAHQMALAAVFESGCQHYAASIYHLEAWEGTSFLRRLKPKYDGVRVLSGYPGQHAAILRWCDNTDEWIIGCITNEGRTLRINFDFLPEGDYEAEIFSDTRAGDEIIYEKTAVGKNSKNPFIDLELPKHGGAGIYIAKKIKPLPTVASSGYMCDKRTIVYAESMRLMHGSELLFFSETKKAVLLNGATAFAVDGLPAHKRYSVRIFYSADAPCELELSDGKTQARLYLPGNVARGICTTAETGMWLDAGLSALTLQKLSGSPPAISRIHIIDNEPPESLVLNADTAITSGGAELMLEGGLRKAVGVGLGGELLFDPVATGCDGKYIIRINYYAGVEGTALVKINNGEAIKANLGGLGGWGSTKRGELLAREILVKLNKGRNTLRIFSTDCALPHIHSVLVTLYAK